MDENGLPITGAGINYTAVEAIQQRELITYMNMFLLRTCSFLNNFSTKCETKLASMNARLESIDTSITLLETKLNSVEELKSLKLEETSSSSSPSATTNSIGQVQPTSTETSPSIPSPPPPPPPPMTGQNNTDGVPNPPPLPPQPQPPSNPVKEDPRYIKYFRMLKMGVAEEAVRIKMRTEGVDPSFLDRPDEPAPPLDEPDNENSDDDDDDSD